jgi:aryl-alcohol dehydrogenase-like predicted oxidoreductase
MRRLDIYRPAFVPCANAATMEKQKLGRTGIEVSRIGLGCATFGREIDEAASFALMDYAVSHDISLFDTAEAYGGGQARDYRRNQLQVDDTREVTGEHHSSEKIIGRWLRATSMREEIFLVSKVTTNFSRQHVRDALQKSLERLNTDRLDLYLLHSFDRNTRLEDALEAIEEVKRAGLARFVGCSNFTGAQTREALALSGSRGLPRLDAVEAVCNLAIRDVEEDLLPLCAQECLGFLAYSPLAAGFLTGKYSGDRSAIPTGSRFHVIPGHADLYFNEQCFQALSQLQALERETGIPAVQLAIAWVLAHPAVTSVLCGARVVSHLESALAATKFRFPSHSVCQ